MSYWIFKVLFGILFKIVFYFKVEGRENLPKSTNYILAGNHTSFLDPLLAMAAISKRVYCITARYLYKVWWIGWFLQRAGALPTGSSSEKSIALIMENKIVGLFPEGKCSVDGKLGEFKRGVALLGYRTGRPIVPCAIIGAFKVLPWKAKFPKLFLPIKFKIGKPVYLLKEHEELIDDIQLQEGTFKIRNAIKEMLDAG